MYSVINYIVELSSYGDLNILFMCLYCSLVLSQITAGVWWSYILDWSEQKLVPKDREWGPQYLSLKPHLNIREDDHR